MPYLWNKVCKYQNRKTIRGEPLLDPEKWKNIPIWVASNHLTEVSQEEFDLACVEFYPKPASKKTTKKVELKKAVIKKPEPKKVIKKAELPKEPEDRKENKEPDTSKQDEAIQKLKAQRQRTEMLLAQMSMLKRK